VRRIISGSVLLSCSEMSRSELSKDHEEPGLNFMALRKEPISVALLALVHREY